MANQRHRLYCLSLLSGALLLIYLPIMTSLDPSLQLTSAVDFIRTRCEATSYPELCYTSLSPYANAVQQDPRKLARLAVKLSLSEARRVYFSVSRVSPVGFDLSAMSALRDCITSYGAAVDQIRRSFNQIRQITPGDSFRFQMSNVQTWMSAALTNEDTCTDGFQGVTDGLLKSGVLDDTTTLKKITSIALNLVNVFAQAEQAS